VINPGIRKTNFWNMVHDQLSCRSDHKLDAHQLQKARVLILPRPTGIFTLPHFGEPRPCRDDKDPCLILSTFFCRMQRGIVEGGLADLALCLPKERHVRLLRPHVSCELKAAQSMTTQCSCQPQQHA
jgi:hypothetical protein